MKRQSAWTQTDLLIKISPQLWSHPLELSQQRKGKIAWTLILQHVKTPTVEEVSTQHLLDRLQYMATNGRPEHNRVLNVDYGYC